MRIEIGRRGRELDQGKRIAGRLGEDPPLQLFGQAGPVQFEERARRVVVQPGKGEVREAGLVEITRHAVANREEQDHRLHLEPPRQRTPAPRPMTGRASAHPRRRAAAVSAASRSVTTPRVARPIRKTSGASPSADAKRHLESPALRIRTGDPWRVEERQQELVEPPEGEARLGRRPRRRTTGAPCSRARSPAASSNADFPIPASPRTTRAPPRRPDLIDHPGELLQLPIAPEERAVGRVLRPSDQHRQRKHLLGVAVAATLSSCSSCRCPSSRPCPSRRCPCPCRSRPRACRCPSRRPGCRSRSRRRACRCPRRRMRCPCRRLRRACPCRSGRRSCRYPSRRRCCRSRYRRRWCRCRRRPISGRCRRARR